MFSRTPNVLQMRLYVQRAPLLYFLRIVVPNAIIMQLALVGFFTKDNYSQLGYAFTALTVIAVVSIEVQAFFPSFWTQSSWLDYYVLFSILFTGLVTGLAILIIIID